MSDKIQKRVEPYWSQTTMEFNLTHENRMSKPAFYTEYKTTWKKTYKSRVLID